MVSDVDSEVERVNLVVPALPQILDMKDHALALAWFDGKCRGLEVIANFLLLLFQCQVSVLTVFWCELPFAIEVMIVHFWNFLLQELVDSRHHLVSGCDGGPRAGVPGLLREDGLSH